MKTLAEIKKQLQEKELELVVEVDIQSFTKWFERRGHKVVEAPKALKLKVVEDTKNGSLLLHYYNVNGFTYKRAGEDKERRDFWVYVELFEGDDFPFKVKKY